MSLHLWLIYLSVVALIIATPGPSALLCMTHGAQHGSRRAGATVLGGIGASLTLMALSALGLGAILAASELAFQVIKWAGALYLMVLGVAAWRAAAPAADAVTASAETGAATRTLRKLAASGFMVGIGNPKDLLFFSALFPQFLDASAPLAPQLVVLASTWVLVDGGVMWAYAAFGRRLVGGLRRRGLGRLFNRLAGSAFIVAGSALAAMRR